MMDINQKSIINAKCPNIGHEVRIPFNEPVKKKDHPMSRSKYFPEKVPPQNVHLGGGEHSRRIFNADPRGLSGAKNAKISVFLV